MQSFKEIRLARDISYTALGKKANVSTQVPRQFERGKFVNLTTRVIVNMSDALDIDAHMMFRLAAEKVKNTDSYKKRLAAVEQWEKNQKGRT